MAHIAGRRGSGRGSTRARRAGIALAMLLLCAAPASAQTLRGRVLDASTGEPVAQVRVELLRADSSRAAQLVTDPTGRFLFTLGSAGTYRLQATHIAYLAAVTAPFAVGPAEELVVDVRLTRVPIELDPLTVVARQRDMRHEPTYEGLYARYRAFPPIGNRRVFLPHDPEMVNAIDVSDILGWSLPARGCRIVYWNGQLQTTPEIAEWRLETSVGILEGVEYYRTLSDAPLTYRDIPGYLYQQECTSFHVVALWQRTGRYAVETTPHWLPDPPPWHPRASLVAYRVGGDRAPGVGGGVELSSHQEMSPAFHLGAVLRGTVHQLSASTTQDMTSTLTDLTYVLPPGSRTLQLWVLAGDARVLPVRRPHLRVTTSARLQVAQRRFSLESPVVHRGAIGVTSYGWGYGATATVEKRVGRRTTATAGIGQDWYRFRKYEEIERSYNRTAGDWSGTALRLGLIYNFARE